MWSDPRRELHDPGSPVGARRPGPDDAAAVTERLPLFPLGTVLFPGLILPLHVFEDRYRRLVRDLKDGPPGQQRRFGVVALRHGPDVGPLAPAALYDVGCVAVVRRLDEHDDGGFDLVATGAQRFRLGQVDTSLPYLTAEVEELDEQPGGDEADVAQLARRVAGLFDRYRDRVGATLQNPPPPDPRSLSWLVAATTVLPLAEKQQLLAAPDDATRLRGEFALLARENALLRVLPSLPAVDLTRRPVDPN